MSNARSIALRIPASIGRSLPMSTTASTLGVEPVEAIAILVHDLDAASVCQSRQTPSVHGAWEVGRFRPSLFRQDEKACPESEKGVVLPDGGRPFVRLNREVDVGVAPHACHPRRSRRVKMSDTGSGRLKTRETWTGGRSTVTSTRK